MSTATVTSSDLQNMARGPAPFISAYLDVTPGGGRDDLVERLTHISTELIDAGADEKVVEQLTSVFLSPSRERSALGAVIAADGRTVMAGSPESLRHDLVSFAPVPRLGPMIEWAQRTVAHAVITHPRETEVEVIIFDVDGSSHRRVVADDPEAVDRIVEVIHPLHPGAVFVAGHVGAGIRQGLYDAILHARLPVDCDVVALDETQPGELGDAVVRHVANVTAKRQVDFLRHFRFELSHERSVEGHHAVVAAANESRIATLLLNADPDDDRLAQLDETTGLLSLPTGPGDTDGTTVRLVDALMARTLATGGDVVIVPHTGETGPADDLGAFLTPRPTTSILDT